MTCLIEAKNATMMRIHSRQKNMIMAIAVATCSPTMNARYGELGAEMLRSLAHCPPTKAGMSTLCPRLEIGKSSVTPWIRPTMPASPYVRCDMPALQARDLFRQRRASHGTQGTIIPALDIVAVRAALS